jgi:cytochrome c-type biogenesis protein CcmH/NrfF
LVVPASKSAALLLAAAALLIVTAGCQLASPGQPQWNDSSVPRSRWGTDPVFTPARASFGQAFREFIGSRPTEVAQPFPFSHQIHLSKGATCTDCHTSVEQGPRATIPSVNTCMICHSQIATDRPLIQQMTAMAEKGIDFKWNRVYAYFPASHVRFEHAPHIRAKVECSTCHGNQIEQTVARRAVDMDMNFCVSCHQQRQASNDCLTCHY